MSCSRTHTPEPHVMSSGGAPAEDSINMVIDSRRTIATEGLVNNSFAILQELKVICLAASAPCAERTVILDVVSVVIRDPSVSATACNTAMAGICFWPNYGLVAMIILIHRPLAAAIARLSNHLWPWCRAIILA